MTLKLLPVEVPQDTISDPTGRIITPQVINAYIAAAGDFMEAVSAHNWSDICAVHLAACSYHTVCSARVGSSYGMRTTTPRTTRKIGAGVRFLLKSDCMPSLLNASNSNRM